MAGDGKRKKKHVRFVREENGGTGGEDEEEEEEEEEDTLFQKHPGRLRGASEHEEGAARKRRGDEELRLVSPGSTGLRCCITTVMCAAFLGLGMAISVIGPTFPDLAENVGSSVGNISFIFVGRSLGYFGGSILGGVLFDLMNQHLLLALSMMATCAGLFVVPWCKQAIFLTGVMCIVGISMGFLDTGGNIVILNTWGDESGPHVQALHFSFALGALLSPILSRLIPKILPLETRLDEANKTVVEQPDVLGIKKSMLSYTVIATYIMLVSLFLFILYGKTQSSRTATQGAEEKLRVAKHHNALIFLLFLFFFCYVGAEVAYGSYIFTYASQSVHLGHDESAGLNSIFWGVFAAVRGLAICFATCLYPGTMLLLSVIGCTASSLFLLLFNKDRLVLWIGSALYGASMATTFPSGVSWIQQYTTIGGKSASLFVIGAALGEMAIPASVGYIQGLFPDIPVLMYTTLTAAVVTSVLFPVMYKLATSRQDGVRWEGDESEDRRALLSSSGLDEDDDDDDEEKQEDAHSWNDVDFEAIEMNDHHRSPDAVLQEETSEVTLSSNSSGQIISTNGTLGKQTVNISPLKGLLTMDREKND
ncbi:sodium-dependent glucose transporter 1 [Gastrophryne carolinensis]